MRSNGKIAATIPQSEPLRCGLAWAAKIVCSEIHLVHRDPAEALRNSAAWTFADADALKRARAARDTASLLEGVEIVVDSRRKSVTLHKGSVEATARFTGCQGAIVVDGPDGEIRFAPRAVTPAIQPPTAPWPNGDLGAEAETGIDGDAVAEAIGLMFADADQMTNAFLVLHKGKIVGERYRAPFDRETPFAAWSMGKTIAGTLAGLLQRRGLLHIEQDDLFAEWRGHDDPRRAIRLADLMNMQSGIAFSGSMGSSEDSTIKQRDGLYLDHIYVYAGGVDSAAFCLSKPAEYPPGTLNRYRNCDPLLALLAVRRAVEATGAGFLNWPQSALFDRLGMTGMMLETDPDGHFLISGHDYGRARDWARLGLLYLQRGAWGGEQLLDEAFVEFVLTKSRHEPHYGGFMILNRTDVFRHLPRDAFWMAGGGGQRTVVVPSLDLVIVRLGHIMGEMAGRDATMQEALRIIAAAASQARS